jgi:hypothetical protein
VLLVTDRHVAYLKARHLRRHSIYKAKWLVPISEVQNIRGSNESLTIHLTHIRRYDLWILGVWPVQRRKSFKCGSRAIYERTVLKLTSVQQMDRTGGGEGGGIAFRATGLDQLTILSAPYEAPGSRMGTVRAPEATGGGG